MRLGTTTCRTLALLAVLVGIFVLFVDTIPPQSMTYVNMHMMKRRILRYAATNDSLPVSLGQLPSIEGSVNEVTDGWGRPILWQVEGDEVILTSHGRDGVPDGTGQDADMVGVFRTKTAEGRWADELCKWRNDPYATAK